MATNWHYKLQNGAKSEPVRFRELADLIRRGEIGPATEVHPEYDPEWRSAEEVVGLIYTSRRIEDVCGTCLDGESERIDETSEIDAEFSVSNDSTTFVSQDDIAVSRKLSGLYEYLFGWLPGWQTRVISPLVVEAVDAEMACGHQAAADSRELSGAARSHIIADVVSREQRNVPACGADVSRPVPDLPPDAAALDSGTTFDILEIFQNEDMQALGNADPEEASTTQLPGAHEELSAEEAFYEDGRSVKLGSAITDAVHNWDANHARSDQHRGGSSYQSGIGFRALLILPMQWLERLALRALRLPIELAGWAILRGDKLVTRIADRVGHEAFLLGFRLLVAIVAANVSIFAIEATASSESLRFPGWQQERNVRTLPIVGECSLFEYWFVAIDVAIVAGVVAYRLARNVEFSSAP